MRKKTERTSTSAEVGTGTPRITGLQENAISPQYGNTLRPERPQLAETKQGGRRRGERGLSGSAGAGTAPRPFTKVWQRLTHPDTTRPRLCSRLQERGRHVSRKSSHKTSSFTHSIQQKRDVSVTVVTERTLLISGREPLPSRAAAWTVPAARSETSLVQKRTLLCHCS